MNIFKLLFGKREKKDSKSFVPPAYVNPPKPKRMPDSETPVSPLGEWPQAEGGAGTDRGPNWSESGTSKLKFTSGSTVEPNPNITSPYTISNNPNQAWHTFEKLPAATIKIIIKDINKPNNESEPMFYRDFLNPLTEIGMRPDMKQKVLSNLRWRYAI